MWPLLFSHCISPDGSYEGEFTYGGLKYKAQTSEILHLTADIQISENRRTKQARKAEGVVAAALSRQTPDVDDRRGVTITSKALLETAEIFLMRGANASRKRDRR